MSAGQPDDGRVMERAGGPSAATGGIPAFEEEPVLGRYPVVAFSFNADASKLVLLYRDPATGETVSQIPSEVALKQYEEAQRKERKENQPKLELVVGGTGSVVPTRGTTPGTSASAPADGGTAPSDGAGKAAAPGTAPAPAPAAARAAAGGGTTPPINLVI
ncbi:hypothetical protein [Azospirillum sp. ST 5-10]|uniref:hypothetical protein n=1 Tax=Azospirillum sp. ST 5-10 TaxID=3445776 RepID=UPI003F49DBB4